MNLEQGDPTWKTRPVSELVGETLKHAGVAITVTSVTDLLVFFIGASTVSNSSKDIVFSIFKQLAGHLSYIHQGRSQYGCPGTHGY